MVFACVVLLLCNYDKWYPIDTTKRQQSRESTEMWDLLCCLTFLSISEGQLVALRAVARECLRFVVVDAEDGRQSSDDHQLAKPAGGTE